MAEINDFKNGWEFMAKVLGINQSGYFGKKAYQYDEEVRKFSDAINKHKYSNLGVEQFKGYVAEEWHAATFNIDAIQKNSEHRARTLHSTEFGSVDIQTNFGKKYSSKYMSTPKKTATAQAKYVREIGQAKYLGQERLVPSDHLDMAIDEANRQAKRNILTRPETSDSYVETAKHLTDKVSDGKGVASKKLSTSEARQIAKERKEDKFNPKNHGYNVKSNYIKGGMKAGLTAATITAVMQLAPEMYKAIDYLIKHGEIDVNQMKQSGEKIITSSGESFLRGSTAYLVEIIIEKGLLGKTLKSIDPTIIGVMVTIIMSTIKNSILVAAGKMTSREMGVAFVDSVMIARIFYTSEIIGGVIAQVLGWEFPGVAYLIGSLIGCSIAAVYNIGKKKLISFCIDTGFTCFGLVEQNYELPEEVLNEMGIETIPIPRTQIDYTPINTLNINPEIQKSEYETIDIKILRRGVIGVNRIGYVLN